MSIMITVISDRDFNWGEHTLLGVGKITAALWDGEKITRHERAHIQDLKKIKYALIDQTQWNNYSSLFHSLVADYDQLIIWWHNGGRRYANAFESLNPKIILKTFSHVSGYEPLKQFMKHLAANQSDNSKHLENYRKLMEFSYDRMNIVALLILCEGYLATCGGIGLKGWDNIPSKIKNNTLQKNEEVKKNGWWKKIFNADDTNTKIKQELGNVFDSSISKLLNVIDTHHPIESDIVLNVYNAIKTKLSDSV